MAEEVEEGRVPCVRCGQSAWPVQIDVGRQVFTIWLCAGHIEEYQDDFAALRENAACLPALAELNGIVDAGWSVKLYRHDLGRPAQRTYRAQASGDADSGDEVDGEGFTLADAVQDLGDRLREAYGDDDEDGPDDDA